MQGFFLQETPSGRRRSSPAAESNPETLRDWGLTAPEIRRSRIYWTLIAIIFLTTFVTGGVMAHIVPMMRDRGISSTGAANALTVYILGGIAGRLLMGKLLDRSKSPRIAIPFYLLAVAGLIVLYNVKRIDLFVASGALIGVCGGAESEFGPYLHSRYFGLRAFAETYGLQFLFLAVANGLGPVAMGAVFDATGSYQWMLAIHAVLLLAAAALFLSLRPYTAGASSRSIGKQISAPLVQE